MTEPHPDPWARLALVAHDMDKPTSELVFAAVDVTRAEVERQHAETLAARDSTIEGLKAFVVDREDKLAEKDATIADLESALAKDGTRTWGVGGHEDAVIKERL